MPSSSGRSPVLSLAGGAAADMGFQYQGPCNLLASTKDRMTSLPGPRRLLHRQIVEVEEVMGA